MRRALELALRLLANGWLRPVTLAGVLLAVAISTLLISAPLSALKPWALPTSGTRWITIDALEQPRRLHEGERALPLWRLPRAPPKTVVQVYQLIEGPPGPADRLSLLMPGLSGDDAHAFVNGARLQRPAIATERPLAAPWSQMVLWEAPPGFFRPGRNRIDILVTGAVGPVLTGPLHLGPRPVLAVAADKTAIWGGIGRVRLGLAGFVVAAVALLAGLLQARRRQLLFGAAALAAALAGRALMSDHLAVSELAENWGALDRLLVSACLIAGAWMLLAGRVTVPRKWAWIFGLAMVLGWLLDLTGGGSAPLLANLAAWVVILLPLIAMGWLWARQTRATWLGPLVQRLDHAATGGMILLVFVLAAWSGLALWTGLSGLVLNVAYFVTAILFLALSGIGALAALSQGTVELVVNRLDQSRVIARQRLQIAEATEALELEMRQRAILEERQRLARDMHDGVGGQLVSLIARVRGRRIDIEQVESELMKGLSELRLVVDSLDATGQTLADAMLAFRLRAQLQADGADMALDWSQPDLEGVTTDNPRWVLTLYRFMQEAVTNAVRHSGGQRLKVTLGLTETGRLLVEIADDGRGFDSASPPPGKGLKNLAVRAGQLGGTLAITARPDGGSRVVLEVPLPEQED